MDIKQTIMNNILIIIVIVILCIIQFLNFYNEKKGLEILEIKRIQDIGKNYLICGDLKDKCFFIQKDDAIEKLKGESILIDYNGQNIKYYKIK
ncbi:MAG: hypothetical protein PHT94_02320 [Candidatus Nanoarchaeia archaeon]|nr:hypothetical protein [Candidatus Nanoarchaeia archaeon]